MAEEILPDNRTKVVNGDASIVVEAISSSTNLTGLE